MIIPNVKKISKNGQESMDILTHAFLEKREIYLFEEINDAVAVSLIAQLNYLDLAGNERIRIYINSPGGSVSAGLAIVDAISRCKCDVSTVCTGLSASMAAVILSCGTKGERYVTPLSEIMIHQPLGGVSGQATDIELTARHIAGTKKKINRLLSESTGQSVEKIAVDTDRDYYLSAEEAVNYGLVDGLYTSNDK